MERKIRAIISDDTDELYPGASKTLASYGIELIPAPRDGAKVLELIASRMPDAVILDAFMSKLDAIAVISASHWSGA